MKVLVAEDDNMYRRKLREVLQSYNFEPVEARSEADATKILLKQATDIGVALVDLKMEKRLSGVSLIELIRDSYPWIISIALTGLGNSVNLDKCMEAGAFSFLQKEKVQPEKLIQTIMRAADRHKREKARQKPELKKRLKPIAQSLQDAAELLRRLIEDI